MKVSGFGYWSGRDVTLEFRPAPPDTGVVFVRRDSPAPKAIPARVENRVEVPRRTNLVSGGAAVEMVEHVLAALAGMQIDNCEVWTDAAEMPGCDGSALAFVEALREAGTVRQGLPRPQLVVSETLRVGGEESWVEAQPTRGHGMSVKCHLNYAEAPIIGRQTVQLEITPQSFCRELASARTFLLKEEADWLRSQGLGLRATTKDLLVFDKEFPIDNEVRFENECVRHKALDLVGDLALAGCDLVGHFVAYRSGHRLNAELVRTLLAECQVVDRLRQSA